MKLFKWMLCSNEFLKDNRGNLIILRIKKKTRKNSLAIVFRIATLFTFFTSICEPATGLTWDKLPTVYVSDYAGVDFGAKVMAARDALPESGGTMDASGFKTPQDWITPIVINKPIKLILPCVQLNAKNANLIITAPSGNKVLSGVDVGGCGLSTRIVTEGGKQYRNRVIRVLGDYAPALLSPPVGPIATGTSSSGSAIITKVSNPSSHAGFEGLLTTIRIGDSITLVGASTRSTAGFVSPIIAIKDDQITLARKVPVGVTSGTLIFSLGGYRVPATVGSIRLFTNRLVVSDAAKFRAGDMLRIPAAGPNNQDLFAAIVKMEGNVITLAANASSTVDNQVVMFVAMAGQAEFAAAEDADAATLNPGDWVLVGEWMNFASNNSDWNRMEWRQVNKVSGNRITFTAPLTASYGYAAYPEGDGYPLYWRKLTGVVERTHIHNLAIASESNQSNIGIEAQNGRLLEIDHVDIRLKQGFGFETVSQYGASIHDNTCVSSQCADFGGLNHSKIQNNTFKNTGYGSVAILELGSSYNIISDNSFLNADFNLRNPDIAALGGASVDFNVIERNKVSATTNASCFSLLGGKDNVFRENECDGGITGFYFVEWGGPSPVRLVSRNVISKNRIRRAITGVDLSSTLTTRSANNLNSILSNNIYESVGSSIRLRNNTLVKTVE